MSWWSNAVGLGILGCMLLNSCITSDDEIGFQTDLVSVGQVLDSLFREGNADSIRTVTKTITVNQKNPETRKLEHYNILDDLRMLQDYDIATPRWAESYRVTRNEEGEQTSKVTYTTENEKAPVRKMVIEKTGKEIKRVYLIGEKRNMISRQITEIDWRPTEGYSIDSRSTLLLQKSRGFEMEVEYDGPGV